MPPAQIDDDKPIQRERRVVLGLIILTLAVYAQVCSFDFVNYDDPWIVTQNPHLQDGLSARGIVWAFTDSKYDWWHPLTWLSHMVDIELDGMNPGLHHLTNLAFHLANTLLLFGVLRAMTSSVWRSGFVAALFALHPLHVESVAWVTERKDVLSTLFWILTMWAYARYAGQPTRSRYAMVLLWFVLGLMSKPMLVTLPFVLLLLDFWPLRRWQGLVPPPQVNARSFGHLLVEKLPLLALAGVSSIVTFLGQRAIGGLADRVTYPIPARVANAIVSYVAYLGKTVWPSDLIVLYPFPETIPRWHVLAAGAFLAAVTVLVLALAKRAPYLPVGWFWYLGTLVPVIGIVQVGNRAMADRFTYVPLIGIFIAAAWGAQAVAGQNKRGRTALAWTAALVVAACACVTWFQLRHWRDSIALFEHAVRVTPNSHVAYNNLAGAWQSEKRYDQAIACYAEAVRLKPDAPTVHFNLGVALATVGRYDEAITQYREELKVRPDSADACNNMGLALIQLGRSDEAVAQFEAALRHDPNHARAHFNLGVAFSNRDPSAAFKHFSEAVRLQPAFADARNNLGMAFDAQGKLEEAIREFSLAVQSDPNHYKAMNNLGAALSRAGKSDQAIEVLTQATRLNPDLPEAHANLGATLAARGAHLQAIEHFSEAARMRPADAELRVRLGVELLQLGRLDEARVQFEEALRLDPDHSEAQRHLKTLRTKNSRSS